MPGHRTLSEERGGPAPAQVAALQGQMSGRVAGGMGGAAPHCGICARCPGRLSRAALLAPTALHCLHTLLTLRFHSTLRTITQPGAAL